MIGLFLPKYDDQKVKHVAHLLQLFYCNFEEEIGEAMITTKALLLYIPWGGIWFIGVNISANRTSVWFFPLGCYIRQSRVTLLVTAIDLFSRYRFDCDFQAFTC